MTTNKKISLGAAGAMVLSVFLPYANFGPVSASLFDAIQVDPVSEPTLILLLSIGALVTAFLDKAKISRICSGVVLVSMLYVVYKMTQLPGGGDVSIFDFIGFGFYVTIIASIVGVIYSKED